MTFPHIYSIQTNIQYTPIHEPMTLMIQARRDLISLMSCIHQSILLTLCLYDVYLKILLTKRHFNETKKDTKEY